MKLNAAIRYFNHTAVLVIISSMLIVLTGCGGTATPTQATSGTANQASPTAGLIATAEVVTPKPTEPSLPTNTTEPTEAPAAPTDTAGPPPPPTDTPKPAASAMGKVGERRESGGIALTVTKVSTAGNINDFMKPKEGNTYLVLAVLLENVSRDKTPYNPLYFKIKDGEGFEYNSSLLAPDPALKSGDLAKGEKVRGNVAFEVPKTAQGFIVSYEPLVIFGGYEPIKIDLSQSGTAGQAPDATAPPAAPSDTSGGSQVGERRESAGIALTVTEVSKTNAVNDFMKPKEGNTYLVIAVTLENSTRDKTPYNPLYFKVKDADGFEYSASFIAPDPELKSGDLAQGEKVRGNVAFEVPKTAKGFVVSYEPLVILGGYEPITINLGQ